MSGDDRTLREGLPKELRDAMRAPDATPPYDAAAELAALEREKAAGGYDASPWVTWRTEVRVAVALMLSTSAIATVLAMGMRHDLGASPARTVADVLPLASVWVTALAASLRPWHRPEASRGMLAGLALAAVGLATLVAALPPESGPIGPVVAPVPNWACFATGAGVGMVTYLATRVVHRGPSRSTWLAAAAAGAAANVALTLHCPSPEVTHRLLAHAGVGYALFGSLAVAALVASRSGRG